MKTLIQNALTITLFGNACWGGWLDIFSCPRRHPQKSLHQISLGKDESPTADGSSTRSSNDVYRNSRFDESFPDCDDKLSLEVESQILKYLSYAAVVGTLAGVTYCAYKYKTNTHFRVEVNSIAISGLELLSQGLHNVKDLIEDPSSAVKSPIDASRAMTISNLNYLIKRTGDLIDHIIYLN